MAAPSDYFQRDRSLHPPALTPRYKTSVARSPRYSLISLETSVSEATGPVFGHGDIAAGDGAHVHMHFHNATLSNAEDIEVPEKYRDMPREVHFTGTVTRWEPPHFVSHTWEFGDESSEVCYELQEVGDKVRLVLIHRRLETTNTVLSVSGGWHTHLDILVDVLESREPKPFWETHTVLEAEYTKRLGL